MSDIWKRIILFLVGCIGVRLFITYVAIIASPSVLKLMGIATTITAIVWLILFFGGYRNTGPEVFGDKIWWNSLRPVHAILFLLFAYKVMFEPTLLNAVEPWQILLADTVIGLIAFSIYHLFVR